MLCSPLQRTYLRDDSWGYCNEKHILSKDLFEGLVYTSDFKLIKNLHYLKKTENDQHIRISTQIKSLGKIGHYQAEDEGIEYKCVHHFFRIAGMTMLQLQ